MKLIHQISLPLLSFLLLIFLLHSPTAKAQAPYQVCGSTTFTANSTYQSNLNLILSSLTTNSTKSKVGFASGTIGSVPNQITGLVLCRGDVNSSTCSSCLSQAKNDVQNLCPYTREATIYYNFCLIRYANQQFLTATDQRKQEGLFENTQNITGSVTRFDGLVRTLMNSTALYASDNSSIKFGTGMMMNTTDSFPNIYSLVQCIPSLPDSDCTACLQDQINTMPKYFSGSQGARIIGWRCNLRYEIYEFYNGVSLLKLSPTGNVAPIPAPSLSPPVILPTTGGNKHKKELPLVLGPLLCSMFIILIVFVLIVVRRRRATKAANKKDEIREGSNSLLFKLKDLRLATNDFSESYKLGEGGFGSVYKGFLPYGQEIAVKRLSIGSGQGVSELKNEVIILAQLQHKNLVKLLGFCSEDNEKILVYEFLPNTSLDKFLSDSDKCEQLNWKKRYEIIKGIARGVLYLHEESRITIIHRDLKTSNILLNETLLPKISDFGLAKLFDLGKSGGTASRIVGTNGYIAPECFMQSYISTKSDVFSYGVIILEILSGKSIRDFEGSGIAPNLISFVWKKWREGEALNIIDQRLHGTYQVDEVLRCINIALLCVQQDPSERPNMATIVLMLNSYSTSLAAPSTPAFLVDGNTITMDYGGNLGDNQRDRRKSKQDSTNNVTITEMDPR